MATVTTLEGVEELRGQLRGELITPGDSSYEEARKVYNSDVDIRPALIARCLDAADVAAAVSYARARGLDVSVRGGGHNPAGFALVEGGLVVDLTPQRWVRVDADTQLVQVGGGCTLADIDHATHAHGLVVPSGTFGTTGIGGLALGGGIGHFTRKFGLTIDNLVDADVVLADGSIVKASETQNPDLFWAIRGGGGNFGVVTAFTFRAQPLATVMAGPLFWPIERTPEAMRAWADLMADPATPDDLTILFAFLTVPPVPLFPEPLHNEKVCAAICVWAGDPDGVDAALAPLRALEPVLDGVGPIPVPVLNGLFDPLYPPGLAHYWRADFIDEFSDEAIAKYAEIGPTLATPMSQIHLFSINGAASRVAGDATAWANRRAAHASIIFSVSPDVQDVPRMRDWVVSSWEALHPYSATSGGAYVNFMMDEGADRVRATYGENYERLAQVKAKYDPGNLFHVNQNIKPA
jgi:FAD/FMN-containing dehydrogenase